MLSPFFSSLTDGEELILTLERSSDLATWQELGVDVQPLRDGSIVVNTDDLYRFFRLRLRSKQAYSLDKIIKYAQSTGALESPSTEDYSDISVGGVTGSNLSEVNQLIVGAASQQLDSIKIQSLVNDYLIGRIDSEALAYQSVTGIAESATASLSSFLKGLDALAIRSSLVDAGLYQARFQPSSAATAYSVKGTANLAITGSPIRHENGFLFTNDSATTPSSAQKLAGAFPATTGDWTIVSVAVRDRDASISGQRQAFNALSVGPWATAVQMQNGNNWQSYTNVLGIPAAINGPMLPAEYRYRPVSMRNAAVASGTSFSVDAINDNNPPIFTTGRGDVSFDKLVIGAGTTNFSSFSSYFDGVVPMWFVFSTLLTDQQLIDFNTLLDRTVAPKVKFVFEGDSISTVGHGWLEGFQTASNWLGRNIETKILGLGGEITPAMVARIGSKGARLYITSVPSEGETVSLAGTAYTWKSSVSTNANEIKIGYSVLDSLLNLKAAVNGWAGGGTIYGLDTMPNEFLVAAQSGNMNSLYFLHDSSEAALAVGETMANGYMRNQDSIDITMTEAMGLSSLVTDAEYPTWCLIQGGTNDPGDTPTWDVTYANLKALWAAARATGMKVVACTIMGATTYDSGYWYGSGGDTRHEGRNAINAAIRADTNLYDELLDVDALLVADQGTIYWQNVAVLPDGTHPSVWTRKFIMNKLHDIIGTQMP